VEREKWGGVKRKGVKWERTEEVKSVIKEEGLICNNVLQIRKFRCPVWFSGKQIPLQSGVLPGIG
jgi:hypothetical protein